LITVNGSAHQVEASPRTTLADFLRDQLGLTGTHLGCEHGVCGACTVLMDRRPARSCLMLAAQADGHEVVTVEAFGDSGRLSPLQRALLDRNAFQCGFCAPGILATGEWLLGRPERPGRERLRTLLAGHICRCTGYEPILDAFELVLDRGR
jgi:carbon-monoxide dehydrogenase small subunit